MTSHEVISAWLEEQAQEAKEFFQTNEALFSQIVAAALAPEITKIYQSFSISSAYSEPEELYLIEYQTAEDGKVSLGYGSIPDGEYYRSISDLSPDLEPVLNELLALHQPLNLACTTPEAIYYNGALLEIGYSSIEFPTAIFCDVSFRYDPDRSPKAKYDLGNGWYIQTDYHYMYGL